MTKKTFSEIKEIAKAWDEANFDEKAKLSKLTYGAVEGEPGHESLITEQLGFEPVTDGTEQAGEAAVSLFGTDVAVAVEVATGTKWVNLTDNAKSQLGERLGAPPIKWLWRSNKCDPYLRHKILQHLIERADPDKEILLRQRILQDEEDPICRAVLSDVYGKFDHFEFVEIIEKALWHDNCDPARLSVERFYLNDSMSLYLTIPVDLDSGLASWIEDASARDIGDQSNGYGQHGGIRRAVRFTNDETGRGGIHIQPAVWRMVCSNGMYGWAWEEGLSIRHVGTKTAKVVEVADAIVKAFKFSKDMAEEFVASQAVKIKRETLGDLIDNWTGKYQIPKRVAEGWKEKFEGRSSTLWHHINHLTITAQTEPNQEGLEHLERVAGELVYAGVPERYRVPALGA